jgi:hypothetical protein
MNAVAAVFALHQRLGDKSLALATYDLVDKWAPVERMKPGKFETDPLEEGAWIATRIDATTDQEKFLRQINDHFLHDIAHRPPPLLDLCATMLYLRFVESREEWEAGIDATGSAPDWHARVILARAFITGKLRAATSNKKQLELALLRVDCLDAIWQRGTQILLNEPGTAR